MSEIWGWFSGIRPRDAGVALGGLVLLCVWLYQGSPSFFEARAGRLRGSTLLPWWGRLYQYAAALLLWVALPVAWVRWGVREPLSDWGLALGDWRFGLGFVALSIPALAPVLYLNALQPDFQAEYPLVREAGTSPKHFALWELTYLAYYVAWEFFFRGFLQFGLYAPLGPFWSIVAQTVPSTLMHIGKPEGETFAAIVGGLVFGAVALHTGSILYGLLVHWYLGALTDLFCLRHARGRAPRRAAGT